MRTTERNTPPSMIGRVKLVLSAFRATDRSLGVSEIARRTGLAKSTVSRIGSELVEHGFLERRGDEFELGLRLFELGELATKPKDLKRLALAHMTDLRSATGQTIHLAVLEAVEVVYIEILRSKSAPPLPSRVGGRMPAHATGVGKALLAFSGESVVERRIAAGLHEVGPGTIIDEEQFRASLLHVRSAGISYEYEESRTGVCCVAAPILAPDGHAVAAISVSAQVGTVNLERIGPAVQTAALALARNVARRPNLFQQSTQREE
ncbi:IclR family transcriptional regulator [Leucobacter sp. Psy1]|uniref:IclR family transcriptional regulator n=1 Tax=Leucobacter sp. Psy1 TaxID=2875729 RepID=UPI001CD36B8D|nr:IclR family transcriptional regulator [Leucobacter sp. Psy1]